MDGLAIDLPFAFAVVEGGNRCRGAQQDGILLCLLKELHAGNVATRPRVQKRAGGQRRLCGRPIEELLQDRAEIVLAAFEHGANQHSARCDKKLTPDYSGFLEYVGPKWFDLETDVAQGFGGGAHSCSRFRGHWGAAIVFEITDAELPDFFVAGPAQRNGSGTRVPVVG